MIVSNPCKGICSLHKEYKICLGCMRSPLEIKLWNIATEDVKLEILESCDRKRELYGELS